MATDTAAAPAPAEAGAGSGMVVSSVAPNETIYINNINEKVKKGALKKSLYAMFSQFGSVMDVIAVRTDALRGQAWVVFETVEAATHALRQMQGFPFYDKPLRIQFAKEKSDAVLKRDGKFVPRDKRKREEASAPSAKRVAGARGDTGAAAGAGGGAEAVLIPAPPPKTSNAPPNKILFAENLHDSATKEEITKLFEGYGGFKEVRLVPSKHMAFVEFDHEAQSTIAMQALNNFKLDDTHMMALSYAKK